MRIVYLVLICKASTIRCTITPNTPKCVFYKGRIRVPPLKNIHDSKCILCTWWYQNSIKISYLVNIWVAHFAIPDSFIWISLQNIEVTHVGALKPLHQDILPFENMEVAHVDALKVLHQNILVPGKSVENLDAPKPFISIFYLFHIGRHHTFIY